jgi:protein-tyrosine phosphatase
VDGKAFRPARPFLPGFYNAIGALFSLVDIHSHILPGLDDGAQTIDDTLAMLELAAQNGTTDIVATPHANSSYVYDEQVVEQLIVDVAHATESVIRIHRGCDFHLNFDNLSKALENPTQYTINAGRYLMVELPDLPSLPVMRNVLGRLLAVRVVPIITHPERNNPLCANLSELEGWVREGCLLQITAQSFLGRFGQTAQRVAETLMNAGSVHFVASDAHDCIDRPPNLAPAYHHVARQWGQETADALFIDHPTAVIMDEPIFVAAPKVIKNKKSSLFSFWK